MAALAIVPFGKLSRRILDALGERMSKVLPLEVSVSPEALDPSPAFDPDRRQFSSSRMLEVLEPLAGDGSSDRVIGVLEEDLFVPILTFVFGEAQLSGPAAVFSLARLSPTFYGLPQADELLLDRAVKEAAHEVGHTFGLYHCRRLDCVMRASTNVGEVDLKPATFCRRCARSLPK